MNKKKEKILFFFVIIILASFTLPALAGIIGPGGPIVPCGKSTDTGDNENCNICHIPVLLKNLIDYMTYYIAIPLAFVMFGIAGFFLIISGGSPQRVQKGKQMFYNTVIGLVIVFVSWLLINEILLLLAGKKSFANLSQPWNQITIDKDNPICASGIGGAPPPSPPPPSPPGPGPGPKYFCYATSVSPETQKMVDCVKIEAAKQGLPITGVTTNLGAHTCDLTKTPPNISCHYGGTACNTIAHAADFNIAPAQRTPSNWSSLLIIASACGSRGVFCESSTTRFIGCTDPSINHIHANDPVNCNCN